jgi:hypothetical protein
MLQNEGLSSILSMLQKTALFLIFASTFVVQRAQRQGTQKCGQLDCHHRDIFPAVAIY